MALTNHTLRGSHYDVGYQMGQLFAADAHESMEAVKEEPPPLPSDRVEALLSQAALAIRWTFPEVWQEIEGMAAGAGVGVRDILLTVCEEVWDPLQMQEPLTPTAKDTGCTDIVALGAATAKGTTLLGHTNDGYRNDGKTRLITCRFDDGSPSLRGVVLGSGFFSLLQNSAGLIQTGNELTQIDAKGGVPRQVLARAIMSARTIEEAVQKLLTPDRATAYNTILADRTGRVVCVETSATDARVIPITSSRYVHTNHFLHPEMVEYEGKSDGRKRSSLIRYDVATQKMFAQDDHTPESFRSILADHHGYPEGICRHGEEIITQFAAIYEAETGTIWLHDGNPCQWHAPLS